MSLKGNLVGFSLTEILQMVGLTGKNGCLTVVGGAAEGKIYFREGTVFFAATPQNRIPIGIRLVDAGIVTADEFKDGLRIQEKEKGRRRLGEILVGLKALEREQLEQFIQEQILDALYEIFQWTDGTYFFSPDEQAEDEDIGVYLGIEQVLRESQKRFDEWERIRKILPSLEVFLEMSPHPPGGQILLGHEEWRILRELPGSPTPEALRDRLHMTSLTSCRLLARMMEAGLIAITDQPSQLARVERTAAGQGDAAKDPKFSKGSKYLKDTEEESVPPTDVPAEWRSYYEKLEDRLMDGEEAEKESA